MVLLFEKQGELNILQFMCKDFFSLDEPYWLIAGKMDLMFRYCHKKNGKSETPGVWLRHSVLVTFHKKQIY